MNESERNIHSMENSMKHMVADSTEQRGEHSMIIFKGLCYVSEQKTLEMNSSRIYKYRDTVFTFLLLMERKNLNTY